MSTLDLIIKNGQVVTAEEEITLDIGIADGKIVALENELGSQATHIIDATDRFIFPGMIDPHVHFNEPGRGHWEGFLTGSQAAVAGGVTTYFEMPLNASPPTTTVDAFFKKKEVAESKSFCDFALWGGLVPDNHDELEPLYERGVIGFKAFMSNSGMDDFQHIDPASLKKGMQIIARLPGMRLALHAEDDALTQTLSEEKIRQGRLTAFDYEAARPIESECNAIKSAIELAGETGCPLHIVHVSCAEGIEIIQSAKSKGLDITCETCPHYLYLTLKDLEQLGAFAKCAPPLRDQASVDSLWQKVLNNEIDVIGSDHSPCPTEMKESDHLFSAWGGISGIQHGFPIMLSLAWKEGVGFSRLSTQCHQHAAEIFNLSAKKGGIALGKDADLAIVQFKTAEPISEQSLFYKNKHSPYLNRILECSIEATLLRGQTIYELGKIIGEPGGKFLRGV